MIESIAGQVCPYPIETLVVDNPSDKSDEIAAIVAEFSDRNVRMLPMAKNVGFGRAVNHGTCSAQGDYLFITCDDVVLTPDCLHVLYEAHINRPNPGLTSPALYFSADPNRLCCAGGNLAVGLNLNISINSSPFKPPSQLPFSVSFIPGGLMFAERKLFMDLGMFREDFFMYDEDTELCLRVSKHDRDLVVAPLARALDLLPPNEFDHNNIAPEKIRNRLAIITLHAPAYLLPLSLAKQLLGMLRRLPFASRAGQRASVVGWRKFIFDLPRLLSQRKSKSAHRATQNK